MGIRCAPAMKLDAELSVTQTLDRRRRMKRDDNLLRDVSTPRSSCDFRLDLQTTYIIPNPPAGDMTAELMMSLLHSDKLMTDG